MIDDFWWSIHEHLKFKWERDPTFEEVDEHMDNMFKISKEDEIEYNFRKVYGK